MMGCSGVYNLSVQRWVFITCLLVDYYKSFSSCLTCSISTILGTNSLNSADVPLSISNKQTSTSVDINDNMSDGGIQLAILGR